MNIFLWDFFKTISTQSENSISGVFQVCSATRKKLWGIKVVKQKREISLFSWNKKSKSPISLLNLWKTSEMEFSDRGQYLYSISDRKNNISAQKWNFWIFISNFWPKSEISIFSYTTLMVNNFFWVVEHVWKTPEMGFSDRVDMV